MDNKKRSIVVEALGADDWQTVFDIFEGCTKAEILSGLNEMYPSDNNEMLAIYIHSEIQGR